MHRDAIRTTVDNIVQFINEEIQVYVDNAEYAEDGFAHTISTLESEKAHYARSYCDY